MENDDFRKQLEEDFNNILKLSYKYCKSYDTLNNDIVTFSQQINAKAYEGLKRIKRNPKVGTECCKGQCGCD
jgi:hypothetical protein|tara:strand:+ start:15113 stop:15328 length:216 start_codon:yes stop_codon:yes gene_type:complete